VIGATVTGVAVWLAVAITGPRIGHRLSPATATRLLVSAAVMVAGSGLIVGGLLAATWLARLPEIIELGPWSADALRAHTPVPVAVAVVAAAAVTGTVVYAGTVLSRRIGSFLRTNRACHGLRHADGLIVVDDRRPDAFSTPPPGGRIVVTTGLLRGLDERERRALLAHETSHVTHGHSWWVLAADLAAAMNPVLIPTARAVHQTVERWADEDAAMEVRDRKLVARTLARSALLVHAARAVSPALAAATSGVPQRVAALLAPAPARRPVPATLLIVLLMAVTGVTVLVQRSADEFFDHAHRVPATSATSAHLRRHDAVADARRAVSSATRTLRLL
jgi:Zn-dependent protease with chaperone function